jgi:hypothetical protein
MSDPWSRGTPATWPYGPSGASGDHVTGLANNTTVALGFLVPGTISQPFGDIILPPWKLTTGSGSVSGVISRWLITSEDGSNWTGGLSPISGSDQSAALAAYLATDANASAAMLIDQITASAAATAYWFRERFLYSFLGNIPTYTAILLQNQSGQALSATAAQHLVQNVIDGYT